MEHLKRKAALGIFALLVVIAPLLFGAVDRYFQVWFVALLAVGMWLVPPAIPKLSPTAKAVLGGLIALILVKEFAPWQLFGHTKWRDLLTGSYSLALPWSHNPEPGRALDALLVALIAALWFLWVRTLASDGDNRTFLRWSLFASAGALAIVCLAVHPDPNDPFRIYGYRFSQDWTGYGPFPNRNHTACFLAMGVLLGCGLLVNSARHKKQFPAVASFVVLLVVFVALLLSKSRGGLIALAIGMVIYASLILLKARNRASVFGVAGGALVFGVVGLAFGAKVLSRFNAAGEGEIPTNIRWEVWKNTLVMWKDAPLFGHGLGTFPQVFPLYQTLNLENQMVIHPESSWLLWLAELGLVPLAVCAGAAIVFYWKNIRDTFEKKQGFYMRASGLAAVAVLTFHSMWDVPGHRWGTAGYALAILAVACPLSSRPEKRVASGARIALVPLLIAVFWFTPFYTNFPASSPTCLEKIISLDEMLVSEKQLEKELHWFPLSPALHQVTGTHLLSEYRDVQTAWAHFRIADRLVPASWSLPAAQAVASRRFSGGMALHFWSLAIERSGHRAEEIFNMALENTSTLQAAPLFWNNYVESNPRLLMSYARITPDADGRYYFQKWWNERAFADDVAQFEIEDFYAMLPRYGSVTNLNEWISHHPKLEETDYKTWAALYHGFKDDAAAWKLLSKSAKEPDYPGGNVPDKQEVMESKWFSNPADSVNAQSLARVYAATGHAEQAREVVVTVASQPGAPAWFLQKAAFLQAADGRYEDAVKFLLQDK